MKGVASVDLSEGWLVRQRKLSLKDGWTIWERKDQLKKGVLQLVWRPIPIPTLTDEMKLARSRLKNRILCVSVT